MKKLLLAAGVAMAVTGVQSSFAADEVIIKKTGVADITVPLTNFTYNSATNVLQITTTQTLSVGSGGNDGGNGGTDPDPDPDPDPEEPGEPGGGDDGACNVAGVTCGYDITSWPKEANKSITIPKGGIIASKFTTGTGTAA